MTALVIVTGPPGADKTTVSRLLAQARPNGLHISSDIFYAFPAHPISPYRPAAHVQNTAVIRAAISSAMSFYADGYDVFLDGIFGSWFLPTIAHELSRTDTPAEYAVLQVDLDDALARVNARSGYEATEMTRTMHAEFASNENFRAHSISTSGKQPEEIAAEIECMRNAGSLWLDVSALIGQQSLNQRDN